MKSTSKSIRAFIGAKEFKVSRLFYSALGFEEVKVGPKMSYFKVDDNLGFYLQDAYVKDWVDNSMIFLEVIDLNHFQKELLEKELPQKFPTVRISEIREEEWGRELFMHDPSGVLWHIGTFK